MKPVNMLAFAQSTAQAEENVVSDIWRCHMKGSGIITVITIYPETDMNVDTTYHDNQSSSCPNYSHCKTTFGTSLELELVHMHCPLDGLNAKIEFHYTLYCVWLCMWQENLIWFAHCWGWRQRSTFSISPTCPFVLRTCQNEFLL